MSVPFMPIARFASRIFPLFRWSARECNHHPGRIAMLLMIVSQCGLAQPTVTSNFPLQHATGVSRDGVPRLTFSTSIDPASVTGDHVLVRGSQSGLIPATYSIANTVIWINPTQDLAAGERTDVYLTTGIESGGTPMSAAYMYHFSAASTPGFPVLNSAGNTATSNVDNVQRVVAADINGDGNMDLVTGSIDDDKLAWFENNGAATPTFTEHVISTAGGDIVDVCVGDLDNDGDLDILRASQNTNSIAWFRNNGGASPTFSGFIINATVTGVTSVATGDLDGDGDLDVLTASPGDNTVAWFEHDGNNASPSFTKHVITAAALGALRVTTGDVDGDGHLDVIAAHLVLNKISWYQNNGAADPSFAPQTVSTTIAAPLDVEVGDMDGDGDLDIVSASLTDTETGWFENNLPDPFTWHLISPFGNNITDVAIMDINGDCHPDVLRVSSGDHTVAWFQNDGNPEPDFTGYVVSTSATGATTVSAADLTGDGRLNIIASAAGADKVSWYAMLAVPQLTSSTPANGANNVSVSNNVVLQFDMSILASTVSTDNIKVTGSYSGLVAGTFTGGGTNTITFNPGSDFHQGEVICVTTTSGLQSLATLPAMPAFFSFTAAAGSVASPFEFDDRSIAGGSPHLDILRVCDLNADGHLDLFGLNGQLSGTDEFWFQNDGASNPAFVAINLGDLDIEDFDIGDINGDGYTDIVGMSEGSVSHLLWIENSGGAPPFTSHIIEEDFAGKLTVKLGDLDRDGHLDIVLLTEYKLVCYKNDGNPNPQFTEHVISNWVGTTALKHLYITDINNDGDLDIVTTDAWRIYYWENDCGNFDRRPAGETTYGYSGIAVADMDGDGDTDILGYQEANGVIYWFRNNGGVEPTFSPLVIQGLSPASFTGIVPVDIEGDGDMDVVCTAREYDRITLYRNNGNPAPGFEIQHIATNIVDPIALAVGDLDGDGDMDIACISDNGPNELHWFEAHPQFLLTSTSPSANKIQVAPNTNITLNFNFSVESASLNSNNIRVYGSQSGLMQGIFAGGGSNAIVFTPSTSFIYGEQVSVTYSRQLKHQEFYLANPGILTFTIGVNPVAPATDVYSAHWISTSAGDVRDVASADLDGDGDIDIVRASSNGANLAWYRNNGGANPSFSGFTISSSASGARSVVAADINKDGHVDIVLASANNHMVAWYENSGAASPTFTEYIITTSATGASVVAIGDMDSDGDLDIIAAAIDADAIYWYENNGDASPVFSAHTAVSFSDQVRDIAIGDVNGDGRLDIMAAELGANGYAWYKNNGEDIPTFTKFSIPGFFGSPISICSGDVDGDGDLDIVAGDFGSFNKVQWFENNGAATPAFTPHVILSGIQSELSLLTGDIDGDADLDILVTIRENDNIRAFVNDGSSNPGFTAMDITQTANGVASVALADLDGDGDYEFISASAIDAKVAWYNTQNSLGLINCNPQTPQSNVAVDQSIHVLFDALVDPATMTGTNIAIHGSQSGRIPSSIFGSSENVVIDPDSLFFPGERISASVTSNLTKDGFPLVNPKVFHFDISGNTYADPLFYPELVQDSVETPSEVILADINGDGHLDVVEASAAHDVIAWHANNGGYNPLYTRYVIPTTADSITSIMAADLDFDGDIDIVASSYLDDRITWYENSGDSVPVFAEHIIHTATDGATAVATGDLDGDGDIDIASVAYLADETAWFENDGNAAPSFTKHVLSTLSDGANAIELYDWDLDGDLDIVRSAKIGGNIGWFENDGNTDPTFTGEVLWSNANGIGGFHIADLDGNGAPDIVAAFPAANVIVVYYNTGELPLLPALVSSNTAGVADILAADYNGDGDLDILAAAPGHNRIAWFVNDGASPPVFTQSSITTTATGVTVLACGDLDGDGDADITAALTSADKIVWYEMDYQRETEISLINGMLIVEDINGGNSTDNLTFSQTGATLRIHDPANTIRSVGPNCVAIDTHTIEMPLDSVSGCRIELHDGVDVVNIYTPMVVADSGLTVHGAHYINQNATTLTSLSGDIVLEAIGTPGGVDLYGSLIAQDSADIIIDAIPIVSLRGFISSQDGDVSVSSDGNLSITAQGAGITSVSGEMYLDAGQDLELFRQVRSTDTGTVTCIAHRDILIQQGGDVQIPSGQIMMQANRAIRLRDTVSSVTGDIVIQANQQAIPTSGEFIGVDIGTQGKVLTHSGTIGISGRGGDAPPTFLLNFGVWLEGDVMCTGTGSISITGKGGPFVLAHANGIYNLSGAISVVDGDLILTGTSGTWVDENPPPISLAHIGNQGIISVLGTGTMTIRTE